GVGVALVLVAALAARSISAVVDAAPADSQRVQFTQVAFPAHLDADGRRRTSDALVAQPTGLPEVSAVAVAAISGVDGEVRYWLEGDARATVRQASGGVVTAGWTSALGSLLQTGRLPKPGETGLAVVSSGLADRLSARGPVLGQRLQV